MNENKPDKVLDVKISLPRNSRERWTDYFPLFSNSKDDTAFTQEVVSMPCRLSCGLELEVIPIKWQKQSGKKVDASLTNGYA